MRQRLFRDILFIFDFASTSSSTLVIGPFLSSSYSSNDPYHLTLSRAVIAIGRYLSFLTLCHMDTDIHL
jgi:hypothetical protein